MDDVDAFLAHYGVKGMKWGERKARPTSSAPRRRPSKETTKNLGIEVALGSIGPAALLMGAGPPVSIAIGLSAAMLSKPPVRNAIATSAKSSAALMKEIGDTKLTVMREAKVAKKALTS